jgi:hypothetical protein
MTHPAIRPAIVRASNATNAIHVEPVALARRRLAGEGTTAGSDRTLLLGKLAGALAGEPGALAGELGASRDPELSASATAPGVASRMPVLAPRGLPTADGVRPSAAAAETRLAARSVRSVRAVARAARGVANSASASAETPRL